MIFIVFLFGLICLALELAVTYYLFDKEWYWTAITVFFLCVQTTMSAVWRSLHLNGGLKHKALSEALEDDA